MTGPDPAPVRFWVLVATNGLMGVAGLVANPPHGWTVTPQSVELAQGITAVKVLDVFAPERVRDCLVDVTLMRGNDGVLRVSRYDVITPSAWPAKKCITQ